MSDTCSAFTAIASSQPFRLVQVAVKRAAEPFRRSQITTMILDLNDHHLMAIGLSVLSSEAICKT
jgi:hypothetical protein